MKPLDAGVSDEVADKQRGPERKGRFLMGQRPPLMRIRNYFGEKVALYFAWLDCYTSSLRIPAMLGIVVFGAQLAPGISNQVRLALQVLMATVVSIWATWFLEKWKRHNAFLNLSSGGDVVEREQPKFQGSMQFNHIDDEVEMNHDSTKRLRKRIAQASIIVFACCSVAAFSMFGCLTLKKYLIDQGVPMGGAIAGGLNAMQIGIGDQIFSRLAGRITDFENHRTDSEHENHLVSKTAVFRFINSFGSFFYIGFLKLPLEGKCLFDDLAKGANSVQPNGDCMGELQLQLMSIFISQMVFQNFTEALLPRIKRHLRESVLPSAR